MFSCQNKNEQIIEGDLFFKLISWGSFHKANKEQILKYEHIFDSIENSSNPKKNDLQLISHFKKLKKINLYTSPYIHIIKKDSSIVTLYMNDNDYKKIENYKLTVLQNNQKKVSLKVLAEEKEENIFFINDIIDLKLVDGKTLMRK